MNYLAMKPKDIVQDLYAKMYKNPLKGSREVERCATIMDGKTTFDFPIFNPAKSSRPPPGSLP